ncbi:Uncharacterised protein [Vibrio cholerae]|nr:Uncharacterised protein [Vibrio cholerae]
MAFTHHHHDLCRCGGSDYCPVRLIDCLCGGETAVLRQKSDRVFHHALLCRTRYSGRGFLHLGV